MAVAKDANLSLGRIGQSSGDRYVMRKTAARRVPPALHKAPEPPEVLADPRLRAVQESFRTLAGPSLPIRPVVAESWLRSIDQGADPSQVDAPLLIPGNDLNAWREEHVLARVMPTVRRLILDDLHDAQMLLALSNAEGTLMWVDGDSRLRGLAEKSHFVAGAGWSERDVGTNAVGAALAIDRPMQVGSAEHLTVAGQAWNCAAVPVHDPDSGVLLGILDVSGGPVALQPQSMALVRAVAAAAIAELRLQRMAANYRLTIGSGSDDDFIDADVHLNVLGRNRAQLISAGHTLDLSLRHSELLLLLSTITEGLSGAEVAVALSDADHSPVTVRAEMSRLRSVLAGWQGRPIEWTSRPYRLTSSMDSDLAAVRSHLASGNWRTAADLYRGPLLAHSEAPTIARMRDELHGEMRTALLRAGDSDALLRFADSDSGQWDFDLWRILADRVSPDSPAAHRVAARLRELDAELA